MKRILIIMMSAIIALSMMPAMAFAENGTSPDIWDGTVETEFASGAGTLEDPYLISKGSELAYLAQQVYNGTTYAGSYFKLTADINLDNREWLPIGTKNASGSTKTFGGYFDGNNHTISNLKISVSKVEGSAGSYSKMQFGHGEYTSGDNKIGLFGYVQSGNSLTNLTIHNASVDGTALEVNSNASGGGAAAVAIGCNKDANNPIENVHVTGTVCLRGNCFVGGILGYAATGTSFEKCSVNGDIEISGWMDVGGICGYLGWNYKDCQVIGNENSFIEARSYGNDHTGGLSGKSGFGSGGITAQNCTVEIDINGNGDCVGGMAGMINNAASTLTNCSYTGVISAAKSELYAPTASEFRNIGAMVGTIEGNTSNLNITDCSFVGKLITRDKDKINYLFDTSTGLNEGFLNGGFVGGKKDSGVNLTNYKAAVVNDQDEMTLYQSHESAFSEATNKTVRLLEDISLTSSINHNNGNAVALDLNGKTIQGNSVGNAVYVTGEGTELRIFDSTSEKKGKIAVSQAASNTIAVRVNDKAHITLDSGNLIGDTGLSVNGASADINGGYCEGSYSKNYEGTGLLVTSGSIINITDGEVYGKIYGIGGNGSEGSGDTKINISGGKIRACDGANEQGCAIFHPQRGELNLSGNANLVGSVGVQMCSGTLNVYDDVNIQVNGLYYTSTYSQGRVPDAAAISVIERNYPGGSPTVNIYGGVFDTSEAAGNKAIYAHRWTGTDKINTGEAPAWEDAKEHISVYAGRFTSDVSDYRASNKYCSLESDAGDAMYVVHSHSTCNLGHTYCPATCEGENICHTASHYIAPVTPSEPDNVTNSGSAGTDNAQTNVDMSDKVTVSDGASSTVVDKDTADKIIDKAVANESKEVVIQAETAKGDSTGSTVALPESTVQALAEKTEASVTIKTDSATVTLDKAAVDATAAQAGTDGEVKLVVETVENTEDTLKLELKLVTSKGAVTDFREGNVTVTVPVDEKLAAGKTLVCVYIDDNGKYTKMEGSLASDGKTYTFTTGHFSTYAIMDEADADAIIAKQNIKVGTASAKLYTSKGGKLRVKASAKNATGYRVYYKKSSWKNYKTYTKGKIKTLDKTFKKLSKGKYKVKVKAYYKDYDGTKAVTWGPTSKAKSIRVKK